MSEDKKDELLEKIDESRRSMIKGLALFGTAVAASSMLTPDNAMASKKKRSKKKASKKKVSKKKGSKKKVSKKKASKKKRSKKKA